MKALALVAVLGCGAIQRHPFLTTAAVNTTLTVGAGVCALDCSGGWRTAADGVLIGELALSSLAAAVAIAAIASYTSESH